MSAIPNAWQDELRKLQQAIGEGNTAKGFHKRGAMLRHLETRKTGYGQHVEAAGALRDYYVARLALITTEVAEAIEELRNGRAVDETYYSVKGSPEIKLSKEKAERDGGEHGTGWYKPEGVPSELADIVIRAFDFAHEAGIDLAEIINEKLAYNATRAHMHGRKF